MFPVAEEWPSPQFAGDDSPPPLQNTGKGSLDFGSFVIRDALVDRVPISRPASRASSNAGTLLMRDGTTTGSVVNKQGGEGLAWAAALMGNKDLLAGQEAAGSVQINSLQPIAVNKGPAVTNSPFKLLSIFDPPTAAVANNATGELCCADSRCVTY